MKHSRRPICVRRSTARCARQGALHNRRGAGLRERVRAAAYAVVVCRMLYAVAVLLRGGTGLRNEKTFSSFAEAFGDSAKLFCVRLRLPARRGARLFRPEARRIRDFAVSPDWRGGAHSRRDGPLCVRFDLCRRHLRVCAYWEHNADSRCCLRGMLFRRAGAERCVRRARRCGKIATKELSARDGRRFFAAGRSAAFALALGGFVYWPESTSASRQPSRLPMRKAGKKRLSARAGAAAGRLRAVDRGLRNSTADGGHGMRRVMKKYGLSSRAVRFFPIVRRAVSPGLHNITNEMKNRTILRLPFDRLGGRHRV